MSDGSGADERAAPAEPRCPACNRARCLPRYRLPHGAILECPDCGSALTQYPDPNGGERAIARWYEDPLLLKNRCYALPSSAAQARRRVLGLQRHVGRGRVLELGSGDGAFALACARAGFQAIACDRFLAPLSENRGAGAHAVQADASRLPFRGSLDAAVAFHLLGHLQDPASVLEGLRERLRTHGILYLETPNYASLWRRLRGARWANLYSAYPCHLSARGLERLLARCGFRVRELWTHETAVDLLGAHYYSLRNRAWSGIKHLLRRAQAPAGRGASAASVGHRRRALYRLEAALALRLFCLPGVPMARLDSWLGCGSFVSAIAEREP